MHEIVLTINDFNEWQDKMNDEEDKWKKSYMI
jgi:hypothetical protein